MEMAEYLMFSQNKTLESVYCKMEDLDLEFRKGKSLRDINKSIEKARDPKVGFYKTELELEALATYLKVDVFKKKRTYKKGDRVKIVDNPPVGSGFMVFPGKDPKETPMGKWLGKVMTVVQVQERCLIMKEDNGRFAWTYSLIEKKVE